MGVGVKTTVCVTTTKTVSGVAVGNVVDVAVGVTVGRSLPVGVTVAARAKGPRPVSVKPPKPITPRTIRPTRPETKTKARRGSCPPPPPLNKLMKRCTTDLLFFIFSYIKIGAIDTLI
jgi:hypothetical protein